MSFVHLVLAGNIGAGKTTVTGLLAERLGWRTYYERVEDNPFLEDFYGDMGRWAFALQSFFLAHRVEDHRLIIDRGESALQDRSLAEDAQIFARNLHEMGMMSDREWGTYERLYLQARALLRPPDLIVYLRRGVDGLRENIRRRGRDYEAEIPEDYLRRLNGYYEEWIASESGPLLEVEADRLDFCEHPGDLEALLARVREALPQGDLFERAEPLPADARFILRKGAESALGRGASLD